MDYIIYLRLFYAYVKSYPLIVVSTIQYLFYIMLLYCNYAGGFVKDNSKFIKQVTIMYEGKLINYTDEFRFILDNLTTENNIINLKELYKMRKFNYLLIDYLQTNNQLIKKIIKQDQLKNNFQYTNIDLISESDINFDTLMF